MTFGELLKNYKEGEIKISYGKANYEDTQEGIVSIHALCLEGSRVPDSYTAIITPVSMENETDRINSRMLAHCTNHFPAVFAALKEVADRDPADIHTRAMIQTIIDAADQVAEPPEV